MRNGAQLEALLRPIGPLSAPAVGDDPPVVARLVVQASEQARDGEDRLAAAKRAFGHLTDAQIQAALDQADLDPRQLACPRPSWGQAISLAVPLGLGMFLFTLGCLAILGQALALVLIQFADAEKLAAQGPTAAALNFAAMVAAVCVGVGLQRLERWARTGAIAVGLALFGLIAYLASSPSADVALPLLASAGLCCLGLAFRPVGRWFEIDARASTQALPLKGHAAAAAWSSLVLAALLAVVPSFKALFASIGIALPWGMRLVLDASALAKDYELFAPIVVLFGLAPLLRLDAEHDKTVRLAAWTLGAAAFATICGWLGLTIYQLFEALSR